MQAGRLCPTGEIWNWVTVNLTHCSTSDPLYIARLTSVPALNSVHWVNVYWMFCHRTPIQMYRSKSRKLIEKQASLVYIHVTYMSVYRLHLISWCVSRYTQHPSITLQEIIIVCFVLHLASLTVNRLSLVLFTINASWEIMSNWWNMELGDCESYTLQHIRSIVHSQAYVCTSP